MFIYRFQIVFTINAQARVNWCALAEMTWTGEVIYQFVEEREAIPFPDIPREIYDGLHALNLVLNVNIKVLFLDFWEE